MDVLQAARRIRIQRLTRARRPAVSRGRAFLQIDRIFRIVTKSIESDG
jgi:hypothetical protein